MCYFSNLLWRTIGKDFTVVVYLQAILKIFLHKVQKIQWCPVFFICSSFIWNRAIVFVFLHLIFGVFLLFLQEAKVPLAVYQRYFKKPLGGNILCRKFKNIETGIFPSSGTLNLSNCILVETLKICYSIYLCCYDFESVIWGLNFLINV